MPPTPDEILEALETVRCPDGRSSIVELGLVFGVETTIEGFVTIELAGTSPLCRAVDSVAQAASRAAWRVPGVSRVDVLTVDAPRWTPRLMRPAAARAVSHAS